MRGLKITVVIDAKLRCLLEEGAEREGRSLSNHSYRLLDRAARAEAARIERTPVQEHAA